MRCATCNGIKFEDVYTCECGLIFCCKKCLNEHLKMEIKFNPIKNLICDDCGGMNKLSRCATCKMIVCLDCIDEHKEKHLKHFRHFKKEEVKDYTKRRVVEEL